MPKGKNKHLTIEDRIRIEKGLDHSESFASIARDIGVSTSTVSREVKQNRYLYISGSRIKNACIYRRDCSIVHLCKDSCDLICKKCGHVDCSNICPHFEERLCDRLQSAPFICGDCSKKFNCGFRRAKYLAVKAQVAYEKRLVKTREGITLSPTELQSMIKTVKALLLQGQSFEAICASNNPQIVVSPRTLYRYANEGIFGIANIDLPKKVVYKTRRNKKAIADNPCDRTGRTYSDYMSLPDNLKAKAVQMDTVMGRRGDFKCLLTLHFPYLEFQLYMLLPDHTQEWVERALDHLEHICGESFDEVFEVILTDRGVEFANFNSLEKSKHHPGKRCHIYYCDAMCSHQKASAEKNHVELRKILPKKTSFETLTNYDIAVITSHINSYPRKSIGGQTPYDLAINALPKALFEELGIKRIAASDVVLKPTLLK